MCSDLSLHNKTEFILAKVHRAVLANLMLCSQVVLLPEYWHL